MLQSYKIKIQITKYVQIQNTKYVHGLSKNIPRNFATRVCVCVCVWHGPPMIYTETSWLTCVCVCVCVIEPVPLWDQVILKRFFCGIRRRLWLHTSYIYKLDTSYIYKLHTSYIQVHTSYIYKLHTSYIYKLYIHI